MDPSYVLLVKALERKQGPTYESVHCANNLAHQVRHVADQADEKRVEIQGVENAADDVYEVAKSHNKLKIDIDIGNGDVDLFHGNLNTSVDLHKACNLGIKIQICLELLYN
jgi:hypothetical protein